MKKLIVIIVLFVVHLGMIQPVGATLLHTETQAAMSDYLTYPAYLKIGTIVNASVNFDVSPGAPSSNINLTSATGAFTWNDGTFRQFHVNSVSIGARNYLGIYEVIFEGTGPTIGEFTATKFIIQYILPANPFTTTAEVSDLLLNSTIKKLRIGVSDLSMGTEYGDLATNVSGSVSVPEPCSLVLLGIGAVVIRKRK